MQKGWGTERQKTVGSGIGFVGKRLGVLHGHICVLVWSRSDMMRVETVKERFCRPWSKWG